MKNNIKNELKENFTIIPNELILDNSISDRARFIFCLIASKPDSWKFFNNALAKELNYSVDTLRKYINELIQNGWLEKIENKFDSNDYILRATKTTVSEISRHGESPTLEKSDTYKEVLIERSIIEKEIKKEHPLQKYISENLSSVSKLKDQLTNEQCEKLLKEFPKELIKETLLSMENYQPLLKTYKSVNLTLRKWMKLSMERSNGTNKGNNGTNIKAQRGTYTKEQIEQELFNAYGAEVTTEIFK